VTVLACKSREGRVDVVDLGARLLALDVTAVLLESGQRADRRLRAGGPGGSRRRFVAPTLLGGAEAPTTPVGGPGLALPGALRLTNMTARPVAPTGSSKPTWPMTNSHEYPWPDQIPGCPRAGGVRGPFSGPAYNRA